MNKQVNKYRPEIVFHDRELKSRVKNKLYGLRDDHTLFKGSNRDQRRGKVKGSYYNSITKQYSNKSTKKNYGKGKFGYKDIRNPKKIQAIKSKKCKTAKKKKQSLTV